MNEEALSRRVVLETVRTVPQLRARVAGWRAAGETVALVPTMGGIHDGHLALVRAARAACEHVVVSLFVNPTQFGPGEDFERYPRDEASDARMVRAEGADLLFAPDVAEMYPDGFSTAVTVSGVSSGLCGDSRPGHFQGVATVVAKLLLQCLPDRAYFGEKDYQQLMVIRRLANDLDIPVAIEGVPTVREDDGLALSSRNAYLSFAERDGAPALFRTLSAMAERLADGRAEAAGEIAWGLAELEKAGFDPIDYLEVCDADTLTPVDRVTRPARILAAAYLGATRLIDNVPVPAVGAE